MPTRLTRAEPEASQDASAARVAPVRVTEAMLDEAVERALDGVDDHQAVATKRLWALDNNLDATNAFHRSELELRDRSNFSRVSNIPVVVRHVLTQDEVKRIVTLYPEFDIVFRNEQVHDHAMGAVTRRLDQKLLEAGVPPGVRYKDIGGNVLSHVEAGDTSCVVVHGDHDMKDPIRKVHSMLALRKIASGHRKCSGGEKSVEMAKDILAGGGRYYIDKDARLDETHTYCGIMNQVYDIPMEGLPVIMDSGRLRVLEGKVHFSSDFFELQSGELPDVRGRYEVDKVGDRFRMGFKGSGAPWYDHSFTDFARYGADQVLAGKDYKYSYKVVERRGDTIKFRVMRIGGNAEPERRQYYALPGVDMVDVEGFEFDEATVATTGPLKRKTWRFPNNIWQTLLRDASVRAARGGLDFQSLVDTYRVSVVPHSLNGVPIAAGSRVDMQLLVPMVVHAGFAAYADMVLFDMEVSHTMRATNVLRQTVDESTLYKGFRVFADAVAKVVSSCAHFFTDLAGLLSSTHREKLRDSLVMWRPVARLQRMHAGNVLALDKTDKIFLGTGEGVHIEHMRRHRLVDMLHDVSKQPELAAQVLESCGDYMTEEQKSGLPGYSSLGSLQASNVDGQTEAVPTNSSPPTYVTDDPGPGVTVHRPAAIPNRNEQRTNAILEAITENKMETEKIERVCLGYMREVAVAGGVNTSVLQRHKGRMANPDMWRVANGVLVESALGADVTRFPYAAVICLRKSNDTDSHIWSVSEKEYDGHETATGAAVQRCHYVVQDSTYSGWVFTNDALKIHNGPECLLALQRSLELSADYDIEMHQGGPGAGKTTLIVSSYKLGEVVVCPVRESTEDTRLRLAEKFPDQPRSYWRRHVRTVDSLLVNYYKTGKEPAITAALLAADEAFMCSSGKWHAVFRMLGVSRVRAYGDVKQIPHVPRVDVPKLYVRLVPDVWYYHWMVYRCRPEIMALWAKYYDYKLRTPLKTGGVVRHVTTHVGVDVDEKTALLCMYQADKLEIKRCLPRHKGPLMTVHESEGKTFDSVVLFNFEVKNRAPEDATYLFNKPAYCIVAMSRSRHSFVYVKKGRQSDLVTEAVDRASDPRRIAAVMDVDTAGIEKEF